eukprot:TRINITY_DN7122_c0_g1_i3.p1 TRINITY_DN7122_c0_g1~~TRINITY_DN7122_c0_g1_i3.p1  ORF type:complete len:648 (-),score=155.21 TRINITY_DN7122_c0_g1_i3:1332-3275(-)
MGSKKKVVKQTPKQPPAEVQQEVLSEVNTIRDEADKFFVNNEFQKAIDTYDKAMKLLPDGHNEQAALHSGKAASYLRLQKYQESIRECDKLLGMSPGYPTALHHRAVAYEKKGHLKQSLADYALFNKTSKATDESRAAEQNLREVLSGRKTRQISEPPQTSSTLASRGDATSSKAQKSMYNNAQYFAAKVTLDNDIRVIHFSPNVSYAQLLDMVRAKFPKAGPVKLSYKRSEESEEVVISSRQDMQEALQQLSEEYNAKKAASTSRLGTMLPCLRINALKVGANEVPQPPEEEIQEHNQRMSSLKAQTSASKGEMVEHEVYELDDWLVEFANLFRECLGIPADKQVDLHSEGWEKCTQALEKAIYSEKATPLFNQAADKFKEVTITGLYNWGNVHVCVARKLTDEIATQLFENQEDKEVLRSSAPKIFEALDEGEKRYKEALGYKEDYVDAIIAIGQVYLERAKLQAEFILPPPKLPEHAEGASVESVNEAAAKAAADAMKTVLKTVETDRVESAEKYFESATEYFQKALQMLPKESEETKENTTKDGESEEQAKKKEVEEMSLQNQLLVMWGNMLYEQSQLQSAIGKDWRDKLDSATDKFKSAGCAIKDIRQALANHFKGDEIELPPLEDDQTEKQAAAAEPGTAA